MDLPLARYRYSFRMQDALHLPDYAGSLLRGQFGAALRKVSCMTGADSCKPCPLRATCPYPAIFETPAPAAHALQQFSHVPNPYIIEPPAFGARIVAAGELLSFGIVLVGRAVAQLPLISFALQRAMSAGLGRERACGTLERIDWQASDQPADFVPVWQQGDAAIAAHEARLALLPAPSDVQGIDLVLHTPLRLQQQGQPLRPKALTPRKLVADLLRRITLLAEFHADCPDLIERAGAEVGALVRHAETLSHQPMLRWQDWSRYSSRQQQEMTLGGAVGRWSLRGEVGPLLPWLRLGQWLHVGKNATMGLGGYRLEYTQGTS